MRGESEVGVELRFMLKAQLVLGLGELGTGGWIMIWVWVWIMVMVWARLGLGFGLWFGLGLGLDVGVWVHRRTVSGLSTASIWPRTAKASRICRLLNLVFVWGYVASYICLYVCPFPSHPNLNPQPSTLNP